VETDDPLAAPNDAAGADRRVEHVEMLRGHGSILS
jgi:hypothetical protein